MNLILAISLLFISNTEFNLHLIAERISPSPTRVFKLCVCPFLGSENKTTSMSKNVYEDQLLGRGGQPSLSIKVNVQQHQDSVSLFFHMHTF